MKLLNKRFFIISILITTISILAAACGGSGIAAGPETPPAAIVSALPAHDNHAQPTEPAAPTEAAMGTAWPPLFYFINKDKVQGDAYRITDWRNVETELFAESISEGTLPIDTGQATVTSYLVLVHTPQP